MDTRCPILAAMLLASVLTTAAAMAGPEEENRATARALAYEGHDALMNKDYATAADRFSRADALVHAPTLLLGLARAEVGLGKLTAAQVTYNRILREGVPRGASAVFKQAVTDARRELKKLDARIPSVVITIKGPSAPAVTLDGAPIPASTLGDKRPVNPGAHVIRAAADGFEAREMSITLAEGKQENVTLELRPASKIQAPTGESSPPSVSALDGTKTPPPSPEDSSGSTRRTLGIVGLGLGGVGLALGTITGALAIVKRDSFKDRCIGYDCPEDLTDTISAYKTLGALSTASLIAGAVCAAGGSILLITAPKPRPRSEAWVTPLIGAGYLGVAGAF
jgi:hypothetical protein